MIFAIAPVERLELAVEGLVTVRSSPKSLRALALLCTLGRRRLHIRLHKLAHSLFAHGHTTCTRLNARHRLLLDLEGHRLLPLTRRLLDRHSRAPLLVLALDPLTSRLDQGGLFGMLHLWADIVRSEGLKLVTGHGFDTAARALAAGLLPAGAPRGILFEIWYELGLVGAVATAALVWGAFMATVRMGRMTGSFLMAGLATVLTISIAAVSISQLWWTTQLACAALACAAAIRAQSRAETRRAPVFNQRPALKI